MSYLNNVRLVFTGRFQADVSTVNNDVRHYDNATFDSVFQDFQAGPQLNGWWNPTGSGAFRLLGCRVVAAHYGDGGATQAASDDPVIGVRVMGADDRSSGKIVDIDPQWQLASALWGLRLRLADDSGRALVTGGYRPHSFRDLWFGRMLGPNGQPAGGDDAASAVFQSVLEDLEWADNLRDSRCVAEMQEAAAATGALSIRMTTFAFNARNPQAPGFTLGTVSGVIGPHLPGDPESFILGRRFVPANGSVSWNGCSYGSAQVDRAAGRLFVDLGNAIQLLTPNSDASKGPVVPAGALNDIGRLWVGVLKQPDTPEFTAATRDNFMPIAEIDYRPANWITQTSGIAAATLDDAQLALIGDHPLALAALTDLNAGTGMNGEYGQIAIRETTGGLFVEAEPIVHRIDAPGRSEATIRAARYGAPLADTEITIAQLGRMPGQGGGQGSGPHTPQAPIPDIGVPETALAVPASVTTGPDGAASLAFEASDPGNVRQYIDGQLYLVDFRLPGQGNQVRSAFDYIVLHVREAWPAPASPAWDDVAPILQQYGNLYPIMSRQLINLADQDAVRRHAALLRLAFSRPIDDPNHMPVTRDLSQSKRDAILAYLDGLIAAAPPAPIPAASAPWSAVARPDAALDSGDSKTAAARRFARVTGRPVVQ